jgi:hypothetical protein
MLSREFRSIVLPDEAVHVGWNCASGMFTGS